jgi:hypothetical protein
MSAGDGFLRRWSQRKRAAAEPADDAEPIDQTMLAAAGEASKPPVDADKPTFDLASLPKIEELNAASDISAFLQKGVPEALKNAALRRIWTADPAIRDFIGPVDYGWDFNAPETIPGFGALEAGFDLDAAARRISGFTGPVKPSEPGEAPATPAENPPPALEAPVADGPDDPSEASDGHASQSSPGPSSPTETLPMPRRRHGGALPTA